MLSSLPFLPVQRVRRVICRVSRWSFNGFETYSDTIPSYSSPTRVSIEQNRKYDVVGFHDVQRLCCLFVHCSDIQNRNRCVCPPLRLFLESFVNISYSTVIETRSARFVTRCVQHSPSFFLFLAYFLFVWGFWQLASTIEVSMLPRYLPFISSPS